MAFWTDRVLEPKRKYRFLVRFAGFEQGLTFAAKKVNKPEITVSEAKHKYINHTFYYPGGVEWNTVTVTLVDPVQPDLSKALTSILEASGYKIPTSPNDIVTMSKASAVTTLGTVTIEQWGDNHPANFSSNGLPESPDGLLEVWRLKNAWIKKVKFSDLDYESDDLSDIELELRYDWAELENAPGLSSGHADSEDIRGSLGLDPNTKWKI